MQSYLREEWRQASAAKQQGASPDDALKKMDMTKFSDAYGQGVTPSLAAVRRILRHHRREGRHPLAAVPLN